MAKTSTVDLLLRKPPAQQASNLKPQHGAFALALHEEAKTPNKADALADGSAGRTRHNSERHRMQARDDEPPSSDPVKHADRTSSGRKAEWRPPQKIEPRDEPNRDETTVDQSGENTDVAAKDRTEPDDRPTSLDADDLGAEDTLSTDNDKELMLHGTGTAVVVPIVPEGENTVSETFVSMHIQPIDKSEPASDGTHDSHPHIGSGKSARTDDPNTTPTLADIGPSGDDPASDAKQAEADSDAAQHQPISRVTTSTGSETAVLPPTDDANKYDPVSTEKAGNSFVDFLRETSQAGHPDISTEPSNQASSEHNIAQNSNPTVQQSSLSSYFAPQEIQRNHHIPYTAMPIEIGLRALDGAREIELELSPRELGQVNVVISVNPQMPIQISFVVEQQQTLVLLMQDANQIRSALEQAGFSTTDTSLQFSLRQDTPSHSNAQHNGSRKASSRKDAIASADISDTTIANTIRGSMYFRQLDLSV